jgi:glycosyltransferase involved in cell wall biosynthesis
MSRPTNCQLLHGLRVGGAEVLAARLARRLGDEFRFVFVCLDELGTLGEELRGDGFTVHVLGRRPGVDWRCASRLAAILRVERVDLVHAHQYTPFFYGSMARLPSGRPPVLFTEHGRWFPDYPRAKRILANRFLLRRRDRAVGVCRSVREALIRNEGLPAGRVAVIYNGIDLHPAAATGPDSEGARRAMGVGPEEMVILQVARLDALKDHATAIRTLERVVSRREDARLVLIGEGPELSKIQELARRRGVAPFVRFLGLRTDVARLLPGADMLLLTSVSEGMPLTLIEGMAAGLPIVATRVGGVGEVVEEGRTGLLASPGDDAALSEAILRLAGEPGLRSQMARHGPGRARDLFSEGRMHDAYLRLYREMIRG